MKIFVNGQSINLVQNDFIAQGGQGQVYGKGGTVYKIYHNPKDMIPDTKMRELSKLTKDNILGPKDVVYNDSNKPIGYTMRRVVDSVPLAKLFVSTFLSKNNITNKEITDLVMELERTTEHIHSAKCLIVDYNEFNFLADGKTYTIPYFIDVDNYQTQSYPATVIMPSIRDYSSKSFSELSDWYSFAIIACQLFTGIHPFKGDHPKYSKKDLIKRMTDNVSIFNKYVQVPSNVRDFSNIPTEYFNWFMDIFEKGNRSKPPTSFKGTTVAHKAIRQTVTSSAKFDVLELKELNEDILYFARVFGMSVFKTKSKFFINRTTIDCHDKEELIFSSSSNIPVKVKLEQNKAILTSTSRDVRVNSAMPLLAEQMMIANNTLYLKKYDSLFEIMLLEMNNQIFPRVVNKWRVMPFSSQLFSGIIYEDVLGKPYFVIPIEQKKCVTVSIKELEGYKVVDAKYSKGKAIIIGHKNGQYDRFYIFFTDKNHTNYKCYIDADVMYQGINMAVLDNGTMVEIPDDGILRICKDAFDKGFTIMDKTIKFNMKLYDGQTDVLFTMHNKLYSIRNKEIYGK